MLCVTVSENIKRNAMDINFKVCLWIRDGHKMVDTIQVHHTVSNEEKERLTKIIKFLQECREQPIEEIIADALMIGMRTKAFVIYEQQEGDKAEQCG